MTYLHNANRLAETQERIMTLIDFSPSMDESDYTPTRRQGAIEANWRFIEAKAARHPDDQVGIIAFDDASTLLHAPRPAGAGLKALRDSLRKEPPSSFGTDFTAALKLAETHLFGRQAAQADGGLLSKFFHGLFVEPPPVAVPPPDAATRRIILLTDGQHNGGGDPVAVAGRLKKAGVVIECIGIAGIREDVDEAILKQIASKDEHGQPRYYFIGDTTTLIKKYKTMANQLKAI